MSVELNLLETTQLRLTNTDSKQLALWLEPWARLYILEPQSSVDVVFEAETVGVPEVFHEPNRVVVYAWPSATARVLCNGVEMVEQPQS